MLISGIYKYFFVFPFGQFKKDLLQCSIHKAFVMLYNNFYVPHENLNRRALVHHDFWIEFAFLKKSGAIFFEIHYVFLKYIYLILSCSSPPPCKRGALISVKMDGWVAPATMKLMALSWRCIVTQIVSAQQPRNGQKTDDIRYLKLN